MTTEKTDANFKRILTLYFAMVLARNISSLYVLISSDARMSLIPKDNFLRVFVSLNGISISSAIRQYKNQDCYLYNRFTKCLLQA